MVDRAITRWAENAAPGDIQDPGLAQELSGYSALQTLPHDEANYLLRQLGLRPAVYEHPSRLAESLADGGFGFVFANPGAARGDDVWNDNTGVLGNSPVACDGRRLFKSVGLGGSNIIAIDPLTGAQDVTFEAELGGSADAMSADGEALFVARVTDNTIRKWDPFTGAAVPGFTPYAWGDDVVALYSDSNSLFAAGALSGGARLRRLDPTTGAVLDSIALTNTPLGVLTDGRWTYVAGGGDNNMHRVQYFLGGGLTIGHGASVNAVAQDRRRVFFGGATGTGSNHIRAVDKADWLAGLKWSTSLDTFGTGKSVQTLHFDGSLLWAGTRRGDTADTPVLFALDPETGLVVASFVYPTEVTSSLHGVGSITGDGRFVYVHMSTTVGRNLFAIEPGMRMLVYQRVASGRYRSPWHNLLLPSVLAAEFF